MASFSAPGAESAIWKSGIFDAHCHPTDDFANITKIAAMNTRQMVIMTTTVNDIDLVDQAASIFRDRVIPAFGYHPWFSHLVYVGNEPPESSWEHYSAVLVPEPTKEFVDSLPAPISFTDYLEKIKRMLTKYPSALVGECGLDKAFRLPIKRGEVKELSPYKVKLEHQKKVLIPQLRLASQYNRPVSMHGVQCHQALFECVAGLSRQPPSICLHSYSGSPDFLNGNWLRSREKKMCVNSKIFISCSVLINITTPERAQKLLHSIPADRILNESDYHSSGSELDEYNWEALVAICRVKGWTLQQGARQIKRNFMAFTNSEVI